MNSCVNSRVFLIAAMLVLTGCSAGGDMKLVSTEAQLQRSYESARVVVIPKADDSKEIASDVKATVAGDLLSSGMFHRIAGANEPADVIVTVDIVEYARVTVAERILVGVFAGRNRVKADIELTNGKTGAVMRVFEAYGKSAAHPLSSEAGYSDALREFSKEVLRGLSA